MNAASVPPSARPLVTESVHGDRYREVLAGGRPDLVAAGAVVYLKPGLGDAAVGDHRLSVARPREVTGHVEVAVGVGGASAAGLVGDGGVAPGQVGDHAGPVPPPGDQVLLAALAAERQRQQHLAARAWLLDLVVAGDVPRVLAFERHVHGVALGEELVQPEREQRATAVRVSGPGSGLQGALDRLLALVLVRTCLGRQVAGRPLDGGRRAAGELPLIVAVKAEHGLDPAGEGVADQVVVAGRRGGGGDPRGSDRAGVLGGRADQGLADDVLLGDGGVEDLEGDVGDGLAPLLARSLGRHGRRGADALHVLGLAGVLDPPDEQRHVRALAAPVGVHLVEDEELKAAGHPDQRPAVVGAGEHQLKHHVVGEQDVRRVGADPVPVGLGFLAGVAGEGDRLVIGAVPVAQVLLQLPELAVGQGVHRVDDDRPDPGLPVARLAGAQHAVHDRHDVGQRLAGACAGGEHVAVAAARGADGVPLVPVEADRAPVAGGRGVALAGLEDVRALRVQPALGDQVGDRAAVGEERVERQPRVRPLGLGVQVGVEELRDPVVADHRGALGVVAVLADQPLVDGEDVELARWGGRHVRRRRYRDGRCVGSGLAAGV